MAVDYFLKIDTIEGESADEFHKCEIEIEIESWSWGETNSGGGRGGGGGGAGKVSMQDFHFTMKSSKASPMLFLACASGQHIKQATLSVRKAGDRPLEYLKIEFSDLLVSSYEIAGGGSSQSGDPGTTSGGGSSVPTDSISFNFTKITWEYKVQKADGTLTVVTAGWDLAKNKKV